MPELKIVAAWEFVDGLLVELVNKTCPLCGYYGHVDDFVEGENWCKECDDD